MGSFTGKALKDVYKDILHTDNSNSGLSTTIKQINCGDGDTTSLYLSNRNAKILPSADSTTNTVIYDADGNALVTVDSTNDLVKAGIGQHNVNTQFKLFGQFDLSPSNGTHHPLICTPVMYDSATWSAGGMNGINWGASGTNPVTSLTVASGAKTYSPVVWLLQSNITIDQINYIMTADAAASANLHLMCYDVVTGAGSTAGDLSNGVVLAQTGSSSGSLSPVTIGDDRASNGTLTKNSSDVNSGKVIIAFVEETDGTDDISVQLSVKYHLR